MNVDLHQHSIYSDGALTPAALIARAKAMGLDAVALTDHDTMRGVPEFLAAARAADVAALGGVELSCSDGGREIHILGYGLRDPDDRLRVFREARVGRIRKILAGLAALGIAVTAEELAASGTAVPSRFHVAEALVKKGRAADVDDAFRRYLREGAPAWAERAPVAPETAVETVRSLGGVSVLAHPKRTRLSDAELEKLTARLAEAGLGGIECDYPTHTSFDARKYRDLCARYGLFATAGSDFHREHDSSLHGGGERFSAEPETAALRALGLGALL